MNTDKTLANKFINNDKYPIWYYKELEEVDIDYVIFNLIKEDFVVELNDKKIEITFGENEKHEIGCNQKCYEGLAYTSYETINKAFKVGRWFIVKEKDTSNEFKDEYKKQKKMKDKKNERNARLYILKGIVNITKNIEEADKEKWIKSLDVATDEELEELMNIVCGKNKKEEN